jgi:hypothetical protein
MSTAIPRPARAVALGLVATLVLLAVGSRPARAAKSTDCLNVTSALCQTVERCSAGFEANGSCKWIYTISRYYWRY